MFGKRLKQIRKEQGYTLDSLSNEYNKIFDAGLNKGTLSKYENEKQEPMISVVNNLATLLNINTDYLLGKTDNPNKEKGIRIPVLGSVPAGVPIEAIEDIIDYEEIDSVTASKGEYFGLKVKGSSMEPRICEGDVLIVKKQDDCESGDIAIVMVNGNDATVKRLMKYADGIRLLPNNPAFEPMYFTNEEIINKPVKIIGKVVENRQKY